MLRDRRGLALAVILWVLVIAAALLTVATYVGFQEQRASAAGRRVHRALARAEAGQADALSTWTPALLSRRLPQPFDSLVISAGGADGGAWRGAIHRLSQGLFLVQVNARDPLGVDALRFVATQARVGWLERVRPIDIDVSAALSAGGVVTVGDGVVISGRDQAPPDWADCPPPDSNVAGIAAESIAVSGAARIDGSPPVTRRQGGDSGLTPAHRVVFDQLTSQATVGISGGSWATGPIVNGPRCDVTSSLNWGSPSNPDGPCGAYFPIVHVGGDLTLVSGEAQGILLVDGNLTIHGSYRFFGLVMVLGHLDVAATDTGAALIGAVIASRAGLAPDLGTPFTISYSRCVVARALLTSGWLVPLRSRSWKQLF